LAVGCIALAERFVAGAAAAVLVVPTSPDPNCLELADGGSFQRMAMVDYRWGSQLKAAAVF
jgi:hypothetical protein